MPTKKSTRKTSKNDNPQASQDESANPLDTLPTETFEETHLDEMQPESDVQPPASAPFVDTGSLGKFIKKVTDKLRPVPPPTTQALEPTSDTRPTTKPLDMSQDIPPFQISANQPKPPVTRKLFPFDQNVPFPGSSTESPVVSPDPRPGTGNIGPRSTGSIGPRPPTGNLGPRPSGGTNPLGIKKPAVATSPLNKLAQKLESQSGSPLSRLQNNPERKMLPGRFEKDKQLLYEEDVKNPFVGDDDENVDQVDESLAAKIKNGSVPAETLRLLITSSMSEAEVLAICSELNIDWGSVPGETREEKTQYLIEYFNKHETHLDYKEVATTLWSKLPTEEPDWGESDARLKELQETLTGRDGDLTPRVAQEEEKAPSFLGHLREDFAQASLMQKVLVIGLSVIVLALLVVIGLVAFPMKTLAPLAPRYTALPSDVPSPKVLELPGGWRFDLNQGVVQDGFWKPDGAEWLQGTEICRLVSLPWNRQLDAVYGTFQPGDELLLTMSNSDLLHYKVTEVKTINLVDFGSKELNQVAKGTSPCLAVVLTRNGFETRQMVVAQPVSLLPWQSAVTATPDAAQSPKQAFPTNAASGTAVPTKKP